MTRLASLIVCVAISAVTAHAQLVTPQLTKPATEAAEGDALHEKYEAAWLRYEQAIGEVRAKVNTALDAQFEKAADAGNLDLADMWDKMKNLFLDAGTVAWPSDGKAKVEWRKTYPTTDFPDDFSEVIAAAGAGFEKAVATLKEDYESLVKEYTKERNLARAKALRDELAGLTRKPVTPAEPPKRPEEKPAPQKSVVTQLVLTEGALEDHWNVSAVPGGASWSQANGVLTCLRDGDSLISKQHFGNFDLQVEFSLPPKCNSGIFLRGVYEIQLLDSQWRDHAGRPASLAQCTGAIWGRIPAGADVYRGPNQWNTLNARIVGDSLAVSLNGRQIIPLQRIPRAASANQGDAAAGPLTLQSHSLMSGVRFRGLTVKSLDK